MNQELRGCLEVFTGAAMWGTIGIFVTAMDNAGSSVAMTAVLRMIFTTLFMLTAAVLTTGWSSLRISKRTLFFCFLLGLTCNGLCNITYNLAIIETGVALGAVMLNTSPIFAAIMSAMFFKEKFSAWKIMALALNVVGCILAVTGGHIGNVDVPLSGIVNGVLSGFMYGLTPILVKFVGDDCNVFVMGTYTSITATLVLTLYENPFIGGGVASLSPKILALGFFYALLPTFFSYAIYSMGVRKIQETSKVPVIASVETLSAVLLGMAIYGEVVSLIQWLGIAIIFVSIAGMNKNRS